MQITYRIIPDSGQNQNFLIVVNIGPYRWAICLADGNQVRPIRQINGDRAAADVALAHYQATPGFTLPLPFKPQEIYP